MKSYLTFETWAETPAHKPLVLALVKMLAEGNPDRGANDLVEAFRKGGFSDRVDAWIRGWKAPAVTPQDVGRVLGAEAIDDLAVDAGMPLNEAQALLSVVIPDLIHQLCPDGRWDPDDAQDTLAGYLRAVAP